MSGRGQALFLMILSSSAHQGEGAEVGGGGWQPQVDLSSQMERTNRQSSKQRSFLGPACRGSEWPTVRQALFQREPLPWEGSKEASELPWFPDSHPVEQASGACKTISASSFPDCRPWGLLESVGWKLANRKRNAMPHLATEICIQPRLEQPCLTPTPIFPPSAAAVSYTAPPNPHPWSCTFSGNVQRDEPSLMKTDFRLQKLPLFKGKERKGMISYTIPDGIGERQTRMHWPHPDK